MKNYSFECQYASAINIPWIGSLTHDATNALIPISCCGSLLNARYILAGNTAIRRKIKPHAAALLVPSYRSNNPNRISKAPLKYTNSKWKGKYGGIICMNGLIGFIKCLIPIQI